jgi:hypothetical protein
MHAPKTARHLDCVPSAVHLVDENVELSPDRTIVEVSGA